MKWFIPLMAMWTGTQKPWVQVLPLPWPSLLTHLHLGSLCPIGWVVVPL